MENFHIIQASFVSPTNHLGARVKIKSERFKKTKIISYDYEHAYVLPQAIAYLQKEGFDVVGSGEGKDCYYIITNTFKSI